MKTYMAHLIKYQTENLTRIKNLPYITDSDHAIIEELEKVLALYDKLETM